jgi:hypothetical protein
MTAIIQFKTSFGDYKTFTKQFNNNLHMDRYISKMETFGYKQIGIHILSK